MLLVSHNVQQRGREYAEGYFSAVRIEDEFDVLSVDRIEPGQVRIIIESVSREGPCPGLRGR